MMRGWLTTNQTLIQQDLFHCSIKIKGSGPCRNVEQPLLLIKARRTSVRFCVVEFYVGSEGGQKINGESLVASCGRLASPYSIHIKAIVSNRNNGLNADAVVRNQP